MCGRRRVVGYAATSCASKWPPQTAARARGARACPSVGATRSHAHDARARARGRGAHTRGRRLECPADGAASGSTSRPSSSHAASAGHSPSTRPLSSSNSCRRAPLRIHPPAPTAARARQVRRAGLPPALRAAARAVPRGSAMARTARERLFEHGDGVGHGQLGGGRRRARARRCWQSSTRRPSTSTRRQRRLRRATAALSCSWRSPSTRACGIRHVG